MKFYFNNKKYNLIIFILKRFSLYNIIVKFLENIMNKFFIKNYKVNFIIKKEMVF